MRSLVDGMLYAMEGQLSVVEEVSSPDSAVELEDQVHTLREQPALLLLENAEMNKRGVAPMSSNDHAPIRQEEEGRVYPPLVGRLRKVEVIWGNKFGCCDH